MLIPISATAVLMILFSVVVILLSGRDFFLVVMIFSP